MPHDNMAWWHALISHSLIGSPIAHMNTIVGMHCNIVSTINVCAVRYLKMDGGILCVYNLRVRVDIKTQFWHYNDVIMSAIASQLTSLTIVIKENIKAPRHWPLCREFTGHRWIPRTKASNAENVFIWWRHHDYMRVRVMSIPNFQPPLSPPFSDLNHVYIWS